MNKPVEIAFFGVSNMLSDLFDCALALGLTPSVIVQNMEHIQTPRGRTLQERVASLPMPPVVAPIATYRPGAGVRHFLGTTAREREALVDLVHRTFALRLDALIHPRAYVSPLAAVAEGVFVGAGTVVAAGAEIGPFAFLNRGVTVGHDTFVGAYARLMPGCNIGGGVRIGKGTTVGMGATIIQEVVVGAEAFVAAGALVTRDVPDGHSAAGSPARFRIRQSALEPT